VRRVLAQENWRRIGAGESVDAVRAVALGDAERAFDLLEAALPRYS
ncbi:MAG: TetR family transcriptional regulator, partial [Streptomyces sp.]|nr:TetR family transcriptional regulator [Streptomyces sp.]NUS16467.1 TetR family transcriptional regulator [Streptomyces sp.]